MRSVTDGKTLHSMHSYFLRPADIGAAVRYEVELLRDGRGYSTRQVRGYQHGKPVYACLASFAAGEAAGTFEASLAETPRAAPGPSRTRRTCPPRPPTSTSTPAPRAAESSMTAGSRAYWSGGRSFDMRHVPGPVYLTIEGERVPHQAVWLRPFDALRPVPGLSDEQRDLAALAYVCDYTILEPVLRVLGLPWAKPGLVTASLDHAMWFHRARHRSTTGCSTPRKRSRPTRAAAWAPASSSPAITVTWPPWSRKVSSVLPDRQDSADAACRRTPVTLGARRHLHPRPPAPSGAVAGDRVHHTRTRTTRTGSTPPPPSSTSRPSPSAPAAPPCARRAARPGPTASCAPGRTRWRRCSPRTSASSPGSACCSARRTTRGRSPPGSACSRPAASW